VSVVAFAVKYEIAMLGLFYSCKQNSFDALYSELKSNEQYLWSYGGLKSFLPLPATSAAARWAVAPPSLGTTASPALVKSIHLFLYRSPLYVRLLLFFLTLT
jgi:hypothetical protein